MASAPAPRPPRASVSSHTHTHRHTRARAHKGKEPYSRSPSRRRRRRRGRRAAAIPCAGPGGRGRSQPPFRAGLLPAPRPTKWGRRREPAAFRAHVAALSLGPSSEGGGGLPRAPGHPNFPRARFKKKKKQKKRQATQAPPWQREGGGGRSGFCPSSLFTRRNFRPDVFSQSRNASRGQSDRKRRPLPAPSQRCLRPPEQSLMRRQGVLRAGKSTKHGQRRS
ncbi:hypothetical protein LEMLEM_LOCUS21003 [Lemmus lemmus]